MINEVEPNLIYLSEVSSVQVGVRHGFRPLPFSSSSSQFPGNSLKPGLL